MKERIILFFSIFLYFILIFFVEKAAFFITYMSMEQNASISDIFAVLYNGLPLDLSMSGYLSVLPALLLICSIWIKPKAITKVFNVYYGIISFILAAVCIADIIMYPHWGFHFDATVFLYLQSPKDALASGSTLEIILGIAGVIITTALFYIGYVYIIRKQITKLKVPRSIGKTCLILFLLTVLLFIPIRGGFTVSTMNIGKVYFSEKAFLNHAAINPQFNLMYSLTKSENFADQYQFYPKDEAKEIFESLNKTGLNDSIIQVLNTDRPNIILFLLESFSANVTGITDSAQSVTPNLDRFSKEGIVFTNFYSNSFRTDRALVSMLSGYPAHPTTAIIKYPQKTQSLPSIPKSLRNAGYDLSFYYGGDADFANMRSYLIGTCTIDNIISDKDFPLNQRMTKWGVPDAYVLEKAYTDIDTKNKKEPFFELILTLSSHEPFDIPTNKHQEPFLNAVSYTDSCLGVFVDKLKNSELWDNTLVIMLADHPMQSYPYGLNNSDPQRFHIPMVWTGGAVKEPMVITDYASQNDLATTILSQLNLKHDEYKFGKDILNVADNKFAFYSYYNGFSMIDQTGAVIYNNEKDDVISLTGDSTLVKKAKAFFQNMYLDLGER